MNLHHALLLSMAALSACASTSAEPGFRSVSATVQARMGRGLHWNRSTSDDQKAGQAVQGLLSKALTVEGALQIALLRNSKLQATYEELSLAQADVVQAGLLSNPVFSATITTAEREALDPNLIVGVTQSFLDLLLIPAKKKIAASEFEQAKYRVGSEVLELAAQVKGAYFKVVAAEQSVAMRRAVADVQQASYELAEQQRAAGGTSELSAMGERALNGQTQIDLARAEAELNTAHEELTRLMGLWGSEVAWHSVDRLPEVPLTEPSLAHLESRAISERLDLARTCERPSSCSKRVPSKSVPKCATPATGCFTSAQSSSATEARSSQRAKRSLSSRSSSTAQCSLERMRSSRSSRAKSTRTVSTSKRCATIGSRAATSSEPSVASCPCSTQDRQRPCPRPSPVARLLR